MGVVILMLGPDRQGLVVVGNGEDPSRNFRLEAGIVMRIWGTWFGVWYDLQSLNDGFGATCHRGGEVSRRRDSSWGVLHVLGMGML